MTDSADKIVTLRLPTSLHKPAKQRLAATDSSFQAVLTQLLQGWLGTEVVVPEDKSEDLSREKRMLLALFEDFIRTCEGPADEAMYAAIREYLKHRAKTKK